MFDQPIRDPNVNIGTPEQIASGNASRKAKNAAKAAIRAANGEPEIKTPGATTPHKNKSIVNKVTEYGALFNRLNDERISKGLAPLKTAMEVLIDAMQSDELDIKDKAKIADKLAPFESSRAPIISIEHVNNVNREEEPDSDEALQEFLTSLRKC